MADLLKNSGRTRRLSLDNSEGLSTPRYFPDCRIVWSPQLSRLDSTETAEQEACTSGVAGTRAALRLESQPGLVVVALPEQCDLNPWCPVGNLQPGARTPKRHKRCNMVREEGISPAGARSCLPLSRSSRTSFGVRPESSIDRRTALSQTRRRAEFGLVDQLACCRDRLAFIELTVPSRPPAPRRANTTLRGASLGDWEFASTARRHHANRGSNSHVLHHQAMGPPATDYQASPSPPVPKTTVKGRQRPSAIGGLFSAHIPPGVLLRLPLPVTRRCGAVLHTSSNWSQLRTWG
jgi:hypothetical protein